MAQPVTESTTTPTGRPLYVAASPIAPPHGAAIDAVLIDEDQAIVIYDPEQFDHPQAILLLGLTLGRPVIDIDAEGVA